VDRTLRKTESDHVHCVLDLTYGSNQGNSHVHWHEVPLPPGVPYEEQQGAWASWSKGVLEIPREEMAFLAERIGRRIET
jgi:diadenosine tetraphosphate (Ap4A) HIT family hydrolase